MKSQTPPSGRVTLSTDSTLFSTNWETVVGKSYPGTNKRVDICTDETISTLMRFDVTVIFL